MGNTVAILKHGGLLPGMDNDDNMFEEFESENVTAPINEYNDMNADNFTYDSVLQNGSFGMTVKVTKKSTNEKFLMKIQSKQVVAASLGMDSWRACMEPRAFAACSHPFVSELFHAFQTETLLILVSSLGTWSDLSVVLSHEGCLNLHHIGFYCAGITSALCYLHSLKLILRNLKPASVLINEDGFVMLTDFSSALDINGKMLGKCSQLAVRQPSPPSSYMMCLCSKILFLQKNVPLSVLSTLLFGGTLLSWGRRDQCLISPEVLAPC
jgi:serine/threonine protein kinase